MTKRRGRPPKTPTSTTKNKEIAVEKTMDDAMLLDAEDLAEIDNLSPKQAKTWMEKIDVLRSKIKERADLQSQEENGVNHDASSPESAEKVKEAIVKETIPSENVADAEKEANAVIEAAMKTDKDKGVMPSASIQQAKFDPVQGISDKMQAGEGYAMFRLCMKLDQLRVPLGVLNKNHFSRIDDREVELKTRLLDIQDQLQHNPSCRLLQELEKQL
ncbi:hypothetical protein RIF29_08969 [Crotalaria pallida]|uniref:Uncharacterized protein n=1 Tax=Crotalaria pallida TaxID=3830 RepID=A0AAN9IJ87_CROPI